MNRHLLLLTLCQGLFLTNNVVFIAINVCHAADGTVGALLVAEVDAGDVRAVGHVHQLLRGGRRGGVPTDCRNLAHEIAADANVGERVVSRSIGDGRVFAGVERSVGI